jgi:hypothetical protein
MRMRNYALSARELLPYSITSRIEVVLRLLCSSCCEVSQCLEENAGTRHGGWGAEPTS